MLYSCSLFAHVTFDFYNELVNVEINITKRLINDVEVQFSISSC